MSIPVSVDILGQRYTVLHEAPSDDGAGECHTDSNLIRVHPAHGEPAQRDTLLHEIVHAIDEALQTSLRERQVRLLSTGLQCVLRSNPAVVAYLMDD